MKGPASGTVEAEPAERAGIGSGRAGAATAILGFLDARNGPESSGRIASHLASLGMELSPRTVRLYLRRLDEEGLTDNRGRLGRAITERGRRELRLAQAYGRVGFIVDTMDELSMRIDFDPGSGRGSIALDVSYVREEDLMQALHIVHRVSASPYSLCDRVALAAAGRFLGGLEVPQGMAAIGTVSGVTLNGVLLGEGIPIRPRFGGVVEVAGGRPRRFSSIISYGHSSVDPLEAFIKGGMTGVVRALDTGGGAVLGTLCQVPAGSLRAVHGLCARLQPHGFRRTSVHVHLHRTFPGIPATAGMAGLVALGGLNAAAALAEAGLSTCTRSMAAMAEFMDLKPVSSFLAGTASGINALRELDAPGRAGVERRRSGPGVYPPPGRRHVPEGKGPAAFR